MPWCASDTVAGHRHVLAPDQPDIGDGVMGGEKRPRRDQRRAVAGEAGDAVDAGGFDGFGEGHCRRDGGEPARQPQLARPGRTEHEQIMGRMPA
jgi:hypothetical protein